MESQRVRQDWVTFTYIQWDQQAVFRIRRVKTIRRSKIQEAKSLDGFPSVSAEKNLPAMQETWVQSLGWEDALEEGTAAHSSILAGRIPWTEEPCGLQFIWLHRVGHHWIDLARAHTHKILEGRETQENKPLLLSSYSSICLWCRPRDEEANPKSVFSAKQLKH